MNDASPTSDEDLLDAACGDSASAHGLDASRIGELSNLITQIKAATSSSAEHLSKDFNSKLQVRLMVEQRSNSSARVSLGRSWWLRFALSAPFAAAAVLALVLLWPGQTAPNHSGSSNVAWADVVRAVRTVQQCHVIAYLEDPRASDPAIRLRRIDWFYKEPGLWRAHIDGEIEFGSAGKDRIWDVKNRQWDTAEGNKRQLLPAKLTTGIESGDMLTPLLAMTFDDDIPKGAPVRSDEPANAQGIDVFDFAHRPDQQWARIWVLHDSKLPLRMHIFQPGVDGFQLVEFDYSDPEPDLFFDAEKFASQAATMPSDGRNIYNIGSKPVSGVLPRGSDQVFEINGGYHAPQILSIRSDVDGDVLLVTSGGINQSPQGNRMITRYMDVTDNWGNRFVKMSDVSYHVDDANGTNYFMPLPPVKLANVPRKLSYRCVVQNTPGIDPPLTLQAETIEVPDPSVPGVGDDWKLDDFTRLKRRTYASYIREFGTLAQKLEIVDAALAAKPDDYAMLAWKFSLLMHFNREAAGWEFFEAHLRDHVFGSVIALNEQVSPACEYLIYLLSHDRIADYQMYSQKSAEFIRAGTRSKNPYEKQSVANLKNPFFEFLRAIQAGQERDSLKDEPKVLQIVAGRDGRLLVELAIPPIPATWNENGMGQEAKGNWYWSANTDTNWQEAARFEQLDESRLWLVYVGKEKQLTLRGTVCIIEDKFAKWDRRNSVTLRYSRTIDVPAPTVDSIAAFLATQTKGKPIEWRNGYTPNASTTRPAALPAIVYPAEEWKKQADALHAAGNPTAAFELYAKAVAAPDNQWPSDYSMTNMPALPRIRAQTQIAEIACLAESGQLDDARTLSAKMWSALPDALVWSDWNQINSSRFALDADLAIARALLKSGKIHAADAELKRIERHRPDLFTVPNWYVDYVVNSALATKYQPVLTVSEQWDNFDELWWDVRDKLAH